VFSTVPVTKEIEVPVTTFTTQTRTGSRTVMTCQPVNETVTRRVCVMTPYTETIQVPVSGCGAVQGGCCQ
jgi:hypothetical protein